MRGYTQVLVLLRGITVSVNWQKKRCEIYIPHKSHISTKQIISHFFLQSLMFLYCFWKSKQNQLSCTFSCCLDYRCRIRICYIFCQWEILLSQQDSPHINVFIQVNCKVSRVRSVSEIWLCHFIFKKRQVMAKKYKFAIQSHASWLFCKMYNRR